MAKRNVVQSGDPVLKKKCREVTAFDERLCRLLDDMGETVLGADGLGLAGPQVGVLRRVFVAVEESTLPRADAEKMEPQAEQEAEETVPDTQADMPDEAEIKPVILEFINPEIIFEEGEQRGYEGCLSFPGRFGAIARPQRVRVRALDRHGDPFEYEGEGLMARCLCHETNHLDGVTIEDLAEYYYDPEVPHELDESLQEEEDEAESAEGTEET